MRSARYWILLALALSVAALLMAAPAYPARALMPDPYDVARTVAEANLIDARSGWLRPSPAYTGSWTRDSFWTSGLLGADVGRRALAHFGAQMTADGHVPTKLDSPAGPPNFYEDESTLIYVIWAYRDWGQPQERIAQAWRWISRQVSPDGFYWTPGGTFHTWHDTLLFPERDVASYNQGLYAVAAIAAMKLGIATQEEAALAADAYRRLYRSDLGYLPVSMRMDYRDASALTGEFLARTIFKISVLDDAAVVSTVRSLPRAGDGFLVLSTRNGTYLDPLSFFIPIAEGSYQNGGSWLLYDAMSWSTAWMAGAQEASAMPMRRMTAETSDGTLYEYLPTGPAVGKVPLHRDYGWNSYAWFALGVRQGQALPFPPVSPSSRDAGAATALSAR